MRKPPTMKEMRSALEGTNELLHYGIKGMRWGIRRSERELARVHLKNDDGTETDGSIKGVSREAAKVAKKMAPGTALVVDLNDGGPPRVIVKQQDGSFRETKISADAERLVKTTAKAPSEMSDREIKEANSRAQQIETYNKLFNPIPDPNAELKAKVDAMRLQKDYAQLHAELHPSKVAKVASLVSKFGPAYKQFRIIDKSLHGALSKNLNANLKTIMDSMNAPAQPKAPKQKRTKVKVPPNVENVTVRPAASKANPNPDQVFNISDVGSSPRDYGNPFIPALESRRS